MDLFKAIFEGSQSDLESDDGKEKDKEEEHPAEDHPIEPVKSMEETSANQENTNIKLSSMRKSRWDTAEESLYPETKKDAQSKKQPAPDSENKRVKDYLEESSEADQSSDQRHKKGHSRTSTQRHDGTPDHGLSTSDLGRLLRVLKKDKKMKKHKKKSKAKKQKKSKEKKKPKKD